MARMIPAQMESDNYSYGERQVFEALKSLPDTYTVFHSLRWNRRVGRRIQYGEADFCVCHPQFGILVIEVKSGGIAYRDGVWHYVRTDDGTEHYMKNPLEQADKTKYYLLGEVVQDVLGEDPSIARCMVESLVWFPSIISRDSIGSLPLEFRPEMVLLESALEHPQRYLENAYRFYDAERVTRLRESDYHAIIERLCPAYSAVPSLKSRRLEQEEEFVRLTNEQNRLLDYLEEQQVAAIQGAAGTGKTMIALAKARECARTGKVLFLCYNRFLREHLQNLSEDNPGEYGNIDFYNLPQLVCRKLRIREADDSQIMEFLENFEEYDWEYRHIIIDEGQDFNDAYITLLQNAAQLMDGVFYIFYDKNQFVQGRTFPAWLRDAECRLVLHTNCRNTFEIADTSGRAIDLEAKVKLGSVSGDKPSIFTAETQRDAINILNKLINKYRLNDYRYDQICLVALGTQNRSILNGVEKIGSHKVFVDERRNDGVLFTTARKFKGLESDVVILLDASADTFRTDENRRLFYVGASRAKHNLDILFIGNEDGLVEAAENMTGKTVNARRAKAEIIKYLQVKIRSDQA